MTTRRNILAFALVSPALAALGACQTGSGRLPAGTRIGAIRVDTSAIAGGWGENARGIGLSLERQLATLFGPAYQPGAGPTLRVAIRGVWLASYAGGGGGGGRRGDGGNNGSDSFDSETTLVDRGGRVLGSWPIVSSLSPTSGGPWFRPDVDQRRIAALIESHALWIRRSVLD